MRCGLAEVDRCVLCSYISQNLHQPFLLSTIAQTGNEKSSSIAVRTHSDSNYALKVKVH